MHVEKLCHNWVSNVLSGMHQKRLEAVCAVVCGALRDRKLGVTALGRSIQSQAKVKHNIKRADRLFSNEHLQSELDEIYAALSLQALGNKARPVIIVDWSDIDPRRKFFLIRAAVAVNGRALTLYEEVHTIATREKRKTHALFLKNLQSVIPSSCVPIIVTDAGFRTPWFKEVRALGWHYIGRIRSRQLMQEAPNTEWTRAKSLHLQASGKPKIFKDILLTRCNPLHCSLVLIKGKPKGRKRFTKTGKVAQSRKSLVNATRSQEPWLLATSLVVDDGSVRKIIDLYSTRMQIEEAFRDLKCPRFGLSLYNNATYKLLRMKILILIGSLVATFAWILGATARRLDLHGQYQANTTRVVNVLSNFFLGIQLFRNQDLGLTWRQFKDATQVSQSAIVYDL